MNEIERAIHSCQNKIRKYEKRLSGADFHRTETMNAISLEKIKVTALREQAERVLCAKCKHYNKTGCSAGFGWCENMDRGTHDEFYCASGKRLEVEP